ncbi:MAG: hypothetical protein V4549_17995 [Bacteroidota bacterium]
MNIAKIYCLKKNGTPFYVGSTINLEIRLKTHKKRFGSFEYEILHVVENKNIVKFKKERFFQEQHFMMLLNNNDSLVNKRNVTVKKSAKTLILPDSTIKNIEKEAKDKGVTPHFIMVKTIESKYGK